MSLFESSNKGLKFDTVGATHTGTVKSAPRERQQTKYGTQEPDFWPNGDPKMQILVDLQTDRREDPNDDGERTLYVASKNMKRAISDAIRTAGATDLLPGGVLSVQYVGNDPKSANPANPAKLYAAQYTAPTSAFAQPAAAAAPQMQQAYAPQPPTPAGPTFQPVQQHIPATPQPVQQPVQQAPAPQVQPGGMTEAQVAQVMQLRQAGIPDDTIATAVGVTAEQLAALPF